MEWLDLNISGHAHTDTARVAYIRTTTFNNICATATTTTTSFLCEWFVCDVTAVIGRNSVVLF